MPVGPPSPCQGACQDFGPGQDPWPGQDGQGQGESEAARRISAAVAALEAEALRRAIEGVAEPVFHQGRECGSRVKHSDTLLMFLLKTLSPGRYGPGAGRPGAEGAGDLGDDPGESGGAEDGSRGRAFVLEVDLSAGEPLEGLEA